MPGNFLTRQAARALAAGYRTLDWIRHQWTDGFGDRSDLPGWQNALRGAALGSATVLTLSGVSIALAQNQGGNTGGPDFGGTDVKTALDKAFRPIIEAGCYVYNTAGPAVFLAAGIAVVIGFILKALQARFWGLFVWGGVIAAAGTGIVLAFVSIFGNPKTSC